MQKNLESALGSMTPHQGLQLLLGLKDVPSEVKLVHGRLGARAFLVQVIPYLQQQAIKATGERQKVEQGYVQLAQTLLGLEQERIPIPITANDAEPRMEYRDGQAYVVVGDGHGNDGYSIELRENGENVMHYR